MIIPIGKQEEEEKKVKVDTVNECQSMFVI